MNNRNRIVNADTPEGQRVGEAIVDAVETQLRENDPPETGSTLARLLIIGETREDAIRMIATVLLFELHAVMKSKTPFDRNRYAENLRRLPTLPSDS